MFRTLAIAVAAFVAVTTSAVADTYVRGHTRSDGTYVQPHHRTNPDSNRFNNYGTQGNTNPYTGQAGTVDPYKQPSGSNNFNSNGSLYGGGQRR